MSLALITDAVAGVISAAAPDAKVHKYQRWAAEWSAILNLLKTDSGKYHGWMISRKQTANKMQSYRNKKRSHIFSITGIYGLDDSAMSEVYFQTLLEGIETAFDANQTLNGKCETIYPTWGPMSGVAGFEIQDVSVRMFGGVLCHYADCRLCAEEN